MASWPEGREMAGLGDGGGMATGDARIATPMG